MRGARPKIFRFDHFLSLTVATAHLMIRVIVVKLEYEVGQYILLHKFVNT